MLRHRLWIVAILFVALTVLIEVGLRWAGIGMGIRSLVTLALCFLVGLEGASLRRWTLGLKGFLPVGVVIADNREEAEQRFFLNWAAARQARHDVRPNVSPETKTPPKSPVVMPAPAAPTLRPRHPGSDVIGSFPQPEPPR